MERAHLLAVFIVLACIPDLGARAAAPLTAVDSLAIEDCRAGQTTITSRIAFASFEEATEVYGQVREPRMMLRLQHQCRHTNATHQVLVWATGDLVSKHCKKDGYIRAAGTLNLKRLPPVLTATAVRCGASLDDVRSDAGG